MISKLNMKQLYLVGMESVGKNERIVTTKKSWLGESPTSKAQAVPVHMFSCLVDGTDTWQKQHAGRRFYSVSWLQGYHCLWQKRYKANPSLNAVLKYTYHSLQQLLSTHQGNHSTLITSLSLKQFYCFIWIGRIIIIIYPRIQLDYHRVLLIKARVSFECKVLEITRQLGWQLGLASPNGSYYSPLALDQISWTSRQWVWNCFLEHLQLQVWTRWAVTTPELQISTVPFHW